MSFSVDLWNGFDPIKAQYSSVRNKLKFFSKLLSTYISIETTYCKSIENLFKEYKENKENMINSEFLLDVSFNKIFEMFEFEYEKRKSYYNDINKIILEPLNTFLESPKIKVSKFYSDNSENMESFNKSINTLIDKQTIFHSYCKELTLAIAQDETSNVHKSQKSKSQKLLEKVKDYKEDYINCIKETNIARENYNSATEKILETIESMFRELVEKLRESLFVFSSKRVEILKLLIYKEEENYKDFHSKIDTDTEIINFIIRNATKEFPMLKIEFLPIKYNVLEKYVKSKNKYQEKEFAKIKEDIKNYFESHNIFKDDDLSIKTNKKPNDMSSRRFTFFNKKSQNNINNSNSLENKIQENKIFIENYLSDLFCHKYEKELKENKIDKNKENKEEIDISNENNIAKDSNQKDKSKENSSIENKDEITGENKDNNSIQNKDNNTSENQEDKTKENMTKKEENNNINLENKDINESMGLEKIEDITKLITSQSDENHLFYIEVIIRKLSFLRSRGYFELKEVSYNILISIFDSILKQNPKNDYILKNIIILAHTFYKLESGKKIYLQEGLKGRRIFNNPETWHRAINYSMNLSSADKDIVNYRKNINEIKEKINKESVVTIPAYLMDIRFFTDNEQVYNDVKYYYNKVYNLDQDSINHQEESYRNTHPESSKKKEGNEKYNIIDINEKKDNKIITINDIITNNNLDIQTSLSSTIKHCSSFKTELIYKNIKIEKVSHFEFIPNIRKISESNDKNKDKNENKCKDISNHQIERTEPITTVNDMEEKKNMSNEVKEKAEYILSVIENKDNNTDINIKTDNDDKDNNENINKNEIKTNKDSNKDKIINNNEKVNLNQIEFDEFVIVEKYKDECIKGKKEENNTDSKKENVKNETNIIINDENNGNSNKEDKKDIKEKTEEIISEEKQENASSEIINNENKNENNLKENNNIKIDDSNKINIAEECDKNKNEEKGNLCNNITEVIELNDKKEKNINDNLNKEVNDKKDDNNDAKEKNIIVSESNSKEEIIKHIKNYLNENNEIINEKANNDNKPENEINIEPEIKEANKDETKEEIKDLKMISIKENNNEVDKEIKDEQNTKKEEDDKNEVNNNELNILNKNEESNDINNNNENQKETLINVIYDFIKKEEALNENLNKEDNNIEKKNNDNKEESIIEKNIEEKIETKDDMNNKEEKQDEKIIEENKLENNIEEKKIENSIEENKNENDIELKNIENTIEENKAEERKIENNKEEMNIEIKIGEKIDENNIEENKVENNIDEKKPENNIEDIKAENNKEENNNIENNKEENKIEKNTEEKNDEQNQDEEKNNHEQEKILIESKEKMENNDNK